MSLAISMVWRRRPGTATREMAGRGIGSASNLFGNSLSRAGNAEQSRAEGDRLIVMAGSHVVLGVVAWTWTAPHLGLSALDPLALALASTGALLPDIDHPSSWVGRRL